MAKKEAVDKGAAKTASTTSESYSPRGKTFKGRVVSDKMNKTVTVEWHWRRFVPKFERYERKRSKVKAHNPENINAKQGDLVRIRETRPISKTKHFVVTEILEASQ